MQLSDIPDWCSVEVEGCSKPQEAAMFPPSLAEQQHMHAASPVAHIDAVTTPMMLMLGLKDRRVPAADGLAYARALRCARVPGFTSCCIQAGWQARPEQQVSSIGQFFGPIMHGRFAWGPN